MNKSQSVDLQSGHIVMILEEFTAAAIPDGNVKSFTSAGISLMLDENYMMRGVITRDIPRCLLGVPFTARFPEGLRHKRDEGGRKAQV